jgi:TetR/AcrR family transcriptional regulator, cholesterol catabolism regulator
VARADILLAAAQIFRQKGYHATSMQDIAVAVRLQKASLYHHVHSKQDILLAILDQALDLLIADLQAVLQSDLTPEQKLRRAIHVYVERLTAERDLAAVLLLEVRSLDGAARKRHFARRDRYEQLWRELIEEGVACRAFRQVDVPIATFALLGVQNWMVTWYREGGRLSVEELADQFADLMLNGLARKARGK